MKHYCIIGGAGFIGSHVVQLLVSRGSQITVIGRNSKPSRILPEGVRYIAGDYGNKNLLIEALSGVDEVIHLAYTSVPKTSFEDPVQDILDNLPETVSFFEVANNLGIEKIVLVSSGGTVYGKANKLPIEEDHPTNPISPYGISKLASEKYAMMFNELKALPVVCVRPGNAFGEGQRPYVGQGFIATAIVSILLQREVIIFGEYGTVRDYIYVSDVANGIIAASERGKPGSYYNIGSGVGRNNKEILDAIFPFAKSIGFEPRVKIMPSRQFDVPVNVLDSTKLTNETDWQALVSFEDGIRKTWNWLLQEYNNQVNPIKKKQVINKN
jgi:UDP-glucose 4-epimerase